MSIDTAKTISHLSTFVPVGRLNDELVIKGMPTQEDPVLAASLLVAGVRSQGEFSTLVINLTHGDITASALKEALIVAFPQAKISDRHGSHFLCHARTGSLKDCRFRPATANERKRALKGESMPKPVTELTAEELLRAAEWKAAEEKAAAQEAAVPNTASETIVPAPKAKRTRKAK